MAGAWPAGTGAGGRDERLARAGIAAGRTARPQRRTTRGAKPARARAAKGKRAAEPPPAAPAAPAKAQLMVSLRPPAATFFGSFSVSTPFSNLASALDSSISLASEKLRATEP